MQHLTQFVNYKKILFALALLLPITSLLLLHPYYHWILLPTVIMCVLFSHWKNEPIDWQEGKSLVTPFLPWFCAMILVSLCRGEIPRLSFIDLPLMLFLLGACLGKVHISRTVIIRAITASMIVIGFLFVCCFVRRINVGYVFHTNVLHLVGGVVVLIAVIWGELISAPGDRKGRRILVAGVFFGTLAVVVLEERTGLLGLMVLVAILLIRFQRRSQKLFLFIGVAALILLCLFFGHRIEEGISDIVLYLHHNQANTSLGIRFTLWEGACIGFPAHPFVGWGNKAGLAQIMAEVPYVPNVPQWVLGSHFHSDFFNIMVRGGLVGLIGWLWTMKKLFQEAVSKEDDARLCMLVALFGMSFFEPYWSNNKTVVAIFLVLWALLAITNHSKEQENDKR